MSFDQSPGQALDDMSSELAASARMRQLALMLNAAADKAERYARGIAITAFDDDAQAAQMMDVARASIHSPAISGKVVAKVQDRCQAALASIFGGTPSIVSSPAPDRSPAAPATVGEPRRAVEPAAHARQQEGRAQSGSEPAPASSPPPPPAPVVKEWPDWFTDEERRVIDSDAAEERLHGVVIKNAVFQAVGKVLEDAFDFVHNGESEQSKTYKRSFGSQAWRKKLFDAAIPVLKDRFDIVDQASSVDPVPVLPQAPNPVAAARSSNPLATPPPPRTPPSRHNDPDTSIPASPPSEQLTLEIAPDDISFLQEAPAPSPAKNSWTRPFDSEAAFSEMTMFDPPPAPPVLEEAPAVEEHGFEESQEDGEPGRAINPIPKFLADNLVPYKGSGRVGFGFNVTYDPKNLPPGEKG